MIAQPSPCDPNRIRELLEGHVSREAHVDIEKHLETCDACRRHLESCAAGDRWWSDAHQFLGPGTIDQAAPATTPKGEDDSEEDRLLDAADVQDAVPSFLQPSENPAMLGRLGVYEILEVLGRGGMGVVVKGYDAELNRYVAIKVLAPHLASSAAARRRFAREAKAAAAVVHEHVVAIHNILSAASPPYLVMSYIAGESLQQRIDRIGPLDIQEILRIGAQVAEGLAAAHAQGLVHRDIKPANILLENGVERVKITDFGLARAIDDASVTHSGYLAGTPQYMSPEQARGEGVDHRCDLFSLGSVLYAMGVGRSPFRAETTLAVLRRICEDAPRPIRELNPDIPAWLAEIVEKLHAKDPNNRFQSAGEVAELLRNWLAYTQHPTAAPMPPRVGGPSPSNSPGTRHVLQWVVLGGVALLGTAIAMTAAFHRGHSAATDSGEGPAQMSESSSPNPAPSLTRADRASAPPWTAATDFLRADIQQLDQETRYLEAQGTTWQEPGNRNPLDDELLDLQLRLNCLERELCAGQLPEAR
jgi:serine/threonine-protein kinase